MKNLSERAGSERFSHIRWLGWKDLNPRITESESAALPLGDTPENEILAADFVLTHSAFIL